MLLLAVIVPPDAPALGGGARPPALAAARQRRQALQASLIICYTAENTAMHNNVPRKGEDWEGGGATLCSGRHK